MSNEPNERPLIARDELDPECVPPQLVSDNSDETKPNQETEFAEEEEEEVEGTPWQEWHAGSQTETLWHPTRGRILRAMEWVQLRIERAFNYVIGTTKLNPFYYTGEIAVFLLLVITATGIPLMLFFQPGFDSSYLFVSRIESQFVARVVRALHRYASDAFMLVSVIHAFRVLFMGRFRGPRWLAWVSGIGMLVLAWIVGVTGYAMVWDIRAQVIVQTVANWLRDTALGVGMLVALATSAPSTSAGLASFDDNGWLLIVSMFLLHLALAAVIGGIFILHILKLQRPRWVPNRQWLVLLALVVLIVSFVPVGMLPKGNLARIPGAIQLDWIFLFFIPLASQSWAVWVWLGIAVALVGLTMIPWTPTKQKTGTAVIDPERCTGCTKCALDCPYKAIKLVPRTDGKPHKYIAVEVTDMCVGCGICIGSCDLQAVSLTNLHAQTVWGSTLAQVAQARAKLNDPAAPLQVVVTCSRHALQGARHALMHPQANVEIIPVECVSEINPDLVGRMLEAGASEVKVVGCPPDDCANREGNTWQELRLTRKRPPRLRQVYQGKPISTVWLGPDEFPRALVPSAKPTGWQMLPKLTWRNFVPAFVVLIVSLALMVALTSMQYQPYPSNLATVQLAMPNPAKLFANLQDYPDDPRYPTHLALQVNDRVVMERDWTIQELKAGRTDAIYYAMPVTPGEYHVRLAFSSPAQDFVILLYDKQTPIGAGQVLTLGSQ